MAKNFKTFKSGCEENESPLLFCSSDTKFYSPEASPISISRSSPGASLTFT